MTQPRFAPILEQHEVREVQRIAPPAPWEPHRPGEFRPGSGARRAPGLGIPGPDQGYALWLADRFRDRLELGPSEHAEDVLAAAVAIALCRASLFGRAPVATDVELALALFGYLASDSGQSAPWDLVEYRRERIAGAAHDYWRRRAVADEVTEAALRMTPRAVDELRDSHRDGWRQLLAP